MTKRNRTQMGISTYMRDVLKGLKIEKEHSSYDSALREIMSDAGIDEQKYIDIARKEQENNHDGDVNQSNEGTEENNNMDEKDENLEEMGFDFDW